MTQLIFPHNQNPSAERFKRGLFALVKTPIRLKFRFPEFKPALGQPRKPTNWIGVAMPNTSVDKDALPSTVKA